MSLAINDLIDGKYRILRTLGEGGAGVVYAAEHTFLRKQVAIKVLHADMAATPEVAARFELEARATAAFEHENVVRVLDFGRTPSGAMFLVMELLPGRSLFDQLVETPKIAPERALPIMMQVLAGLGAAHGRGIVHRDLKPENVFLADREDGEPLVKLLDFGIAKLADRESVRLTTTGAILGTPLYMAPEQARGQKNVDHRVDLHAVGVMLYEMLAAQPPYTGENYNAVLYSILIGNPTPVSEVAPDLGPELATVVMKAIATEPGQRYQSALEFRQALAYNIAASSRAKRLRTSSQDAPASRPEAAKSTPRPTPKPASTPSRTQFKGAGDRTGRTPSPAPRTPTGKSALPPVTTPTPEGRGSRGVVETRVRSSPESFGPKGPLSGELPPPGRGSPSTPPRVKLPPAEGTPPPEVLVPPAASPAIEAPKLPTPPSLPRRTYQQSNDDEPRPDSGGPASPAAQQPGMEVDAEFEESEPEPGEMPRTEAERRGPYFLLRVKARVRFASWDVFNFIYATNISRGTFSFELPREAGVGLPVTLIMRLPTSAEIELEAKVLSSEKMERRAVRKPGSKPEPRLEVPRFQIAVQFIDLDDEKRRLIEAFVEARPGQAPPGLTSARSTAQTPGRSFSPPLGVPARSGAPTPGRSFSPTPGRSFSPTPGRSFSPPLGVSGRSGAPSPGSSFSAPPSDPSIRRPPQPFSSPPSEPIIRRPSPQPLPTPVAPPGTNPLEANRKTISATLMMCLKGSKIADIIDVETLRSDVDALLDLDPEKGEILIHRVYQSLVQRPNLTAQLLAAPLRAFKSYEKGFAALVRLPILLPQVDDDEQQKVREEAGLKPPPTTAVAPPAPTPAPPPPVAAAFGAAAGAEAEPDAPRPPPLVPSRAPRPKAPKAQRPGSKQASRIHLRELIGNGRFLAVLGIAAAAALSVSIYFTFRNTAESYDLSDVSNVLLLSQGWREQQTMVARIDDIRWEKLKIEDQRRLAAKVFDQERQKGVKVMNLVDWVGRTRVVATDVGQNGPNIAVYDSP